MTKEHAEFVVEAIHSLMKGKSCVSVSTGPGYKRNPEIRVNQIIKNAYIVEHQDGTATVGVLLGANGPIVGRLVRVA